MGRLPKKTLSLPVAAALLAFAGCDTTPVLPANADALESRGASAAAMQGHGDLLKYVRQETSRFNSTQQAVRAGYASDPHCVAHPELGAMGHHWANGALIDPVFEPARPEALLYAPGPGGNLRLVGVEYIVINVGQPHPDFDGHPFDVGGVPPLMAAEVPHWSLHVWVHESNPNGLFTPFNPNVTCG